MNKQQPLKSKHKNIKSFAVIILSLIMIIIFCWTNNNVVELKSYNIECSLNSFKGYKIVFLSDLHIEKTGYLYRDVIKKCEDIKPDLILITGDIVDRIDYNEEAVVNFSQNIGRIAPVYWVTGNHEAALDASVFKNLVKELNDNGFTLLDNKSISLSKGNQRLVISGIHDPLFGTVDTYQSVNIIDDYIKKTFQDRSNTNAEEFSILLAHRTEFWQKATEYNFPLILTGHAHGGQIRIPYLGGLYSPGQGFFPKYTSGKLKANQSTIIINRGIGNSRIKQRIFNNPQVVLINFK